MRLAAGVLLALAALASALAAGFFYTWSIAVMPGLDGAAPEVAIGAMQAINAAIRTPEFAFAFFGALLLPLLAGALLRGRARLLAWTSAAVYGAGVIAVTFAVNMPLNEALATVTPAPGTGAAVWRGYADPWTAWNHVRALSAALGFALIVAAVVAEVEGPLRT
jgi:uncharacterized membrane protein